MFKKENVRILAMFLITVMFLSLFVTSVSAAKEKEVHKLSISFHDPMKSAPGTFLQKWATSVEQASDGRIKVEIYGGGVLGGVKETINLVNNGTVDIGWGGQATYSGQFPLTEVASLPLIGIKNAQHGSKALWDLYENNNKLQEEYEDYKVLLIHVNCYSVISFSRLDLSTMEEMKGLNIRANAGPPTGFIEAIGASPVNVIMAELYQALRNNTVDGVLTDWHGLYAFKLYEAIEYLLDIPVYTNTFYFLMNKDSYNRLPEDLQAIIDEHTGWAALDIIGNIYDDYENLCREAFLKEKGNRISTLSDEELSKFKQAADKVARDWIVEIEKKGFPGQEIYNQILELVEKYSD